MPEKGQKQAFFEIFLSFSPKTVPNSSTNLGPFFCRILNDGLVFYRQSALSRFEKDALSSALSSTIKFFIHRISFFYFMRKCFVFLRYHTYNTSDVMDNKNASIHAFPFYFCTPITISEASDLKIIRTIRYLYK